MDENDVSRNQFRVLLTDHTSPAAAAKPSRHLAASKLSKLVVAADQASIPACIAIARSIDARLPNFIESGTQKMFPMLRNRKLSYCQCHISALYPVYAKKITTRTVKV